MNTWTLLIRALVALALCALLARRYVHILQLEGYHSAQYMRWLRHNRKKALLMPVAVPLVPLALELVIGFCMVRSAWVQWPALVLFAGIAFTAVRLTENRQAKKPLVFTWRVKRLYICLLLAQLALMLLLESLSYHLLGVVNIALLVVFAATPLFLLWCAELMLPIERAIQRWYMRDARRKIAARPDLIRIGLTGSYGKTSSKFILESILAERYRTLATPHSYNTPMGLTRAVRELLKDEHQVFIAEMGARRSGEIRELCELISPRHGLLTSIGPQHLETFGSIDTVAATKYELMQSLPANGVACFPADGGRCEALWRAHAGEKLLFGFKRDDLTPDVWAGDVEVGPFGSRFALNCAKGAVLCETRLLGRHNIENILGACAIALTLGMELDEIRRGVSKIKPIEHRLQVIRGQGGVTVLDDSFNANPSGTKAAMDVLHAFPGRHIVITPGMVELGEQEHAHNRAFGREMASAADIAILVGKMRARPIEQGLLEAGFSPGNIHIVASTKEATDVLAGLSRPGDVVLFENDLPDHYDE